MKNQYTGIAKGIEQPHLSTATHIITRTERGTIASWNRKYYKTDEQATKEKKVIQWTEKENKANGARSEHGNVDDK